LEFIPFNRPPYVGGEFDALRQAIEDGHLSADGQFSRRCRRRLEEMTGARAALLVTSATAALEMAVMLTEIGPGDEVIMPSFNFVSAANAVVLRGGTPVFVDIRPDTQNIDTDAVGDAITPRTRAIVLVDYAGVPCEVDELARHGLPLIEDAAQGLMSAAGDRMLGTLGTLGTVSFHETKNVTCGEGGALLVNDDGLVARAEVLRDKGTNRARFFRGEVDKYSWVDIGSSYGLSDLNSAFLWAQLEAAEDLTARRLAIWQQYQEAFEPLEAAGIAQRPVVPDGCRHNGHLYYLIVRDLDERTRVLRELNERGVNAVFHYVPLHSSEAGSRYGRFHGELPATERAGSRLFRVPLWADMAPEAVDRVASTILEVLRPT
jgi:dTDP-4-amino-4,6-dideoxygalactose transaminase